MEWSDNALVLGTRKYGEHDAILEVLTEDHGRSRGFVRGGLGRRQRGNLQPGNGVRVTWRSRVEENLGSFAVEPTAATAARILPNGNALSVLTASTSIIVATLPEREAHRPVYDACAALFTFLTDNQQSLMLYSAAFVRLELGLLAELGFGLDLTHCASTGVTADLVYVSPKSGKAVSREAGRPYHDRLLALPSFLCPEQGAGADVGAVLDGLALTGFFLERYVLAPAGVRLPAARARLADRLSSVG